MTDLNLTSLVALRDFDADVFETLAPVRDRGAPKAWPGNHNWRSPITVGGKVRSVVGYDIVRDCAVLAACVLSPTILCHGVTLTPSRLGDTTQLLWGEKKAHTSLFVCLSSLCLTPQTSCWCCTGVSGDQLETRFVMGHHSWQGGTTTIRNAVRWCVGSPVT